MDQREKHGEAPVSPHSLIREERTGGRRRAGRFYFAASALVIGMLAAFIWILQGRIAETSLPVQEDQAGLVSATVAPEEIDADPAALRVRSLGDSREAVLGSPQPATPSLPAMAMAVQATARPTRTATPIPYVDSTEAVVGLGGASIWNSDGSLAGELSQGAYVSATKRSTDGEWIFARSETAGEGWISVEDLIIFDTDRLTPADIAIQPATPMPSPQAPQAPVAQASPHASANRSEALPTVTPSTGKGLAPPASGKEPIGRIALDKGRLNVRAGPGPTYKVIAKAFPKELYALLGVSDDGAWVRIDVPSVADGFGWAAADFLESSVELASLPVSSAVSSAPAYVPMEDGAPVGDTKTEEPVTSVTAAAALPPMHWGPPALDSGKTTRNDAGAAGLTGVLVIQQEWGGDIYVYDLESEDLRLLTGGFDPSISPDGSLVAFTREGGENGVYVIDVKGGEERLVFGGREHLRSPKFSPDGKFIVFERGDESILCKNEQARCRISVPSPDGDMPERETQPSLARIRIDGSDYWDPMDLPYARVPDWNEDGIVYQSLGGIQIAQNEPNVDTELVYFDILKQFEMDPDWQPGGGRIIFQQREINHWEIYTVNPDGSGLHALTQPPFALAESFPNNVSPAWSPDGEHIVFLSNRAANNTVGDWAIWVMDKDGTNLRRLPIELPFVYTYVSEQMLDWGPSTLH